MWNSVSIDGSQVIIIHSPFGESQRQEEMNQLGSARRQAVESRPRPRSFDVSRARSWEGTMKNGTYRKLGYLRIDVLKTFWDESDEHWWTLQKKGVLDDESCWAIFAAQHGKLRLAVGHESVCHIFSVQQFLSHQSEYLFLTPNIIYYQF